jgi:hypothetical protein
LRHILSFYAFITAFNAVARGHVNVKRAQMLFELGYHIQKLSLRGATRRSNPVANVRHEIATSLRSSR